VHEGKRHVEVATRVVIHRKSAVLVGNLRVVKTVQPLKQDDRPCLQLDSLQEVSELELDRSDLNDASGNILSHGSTDLEQKVVCLAVKLKCTVHLRFFECGIALSKQVFDVLVLELQVFENWVKLNNIRVLEWQVLIVTHNVLLSKLNSLGSFFVVFCWLLYIGGNNFIMVSCYLLCVV